jgi:hypothetical protein
MVHHQIASAVAPAGAPSPADRAAATRGPRPGESRERYLARAGDELAAEITAGLLRLTRSLEQLPAPRMRFSDAQRRPLTIRALGQCLAAARLAGVPQTHSHALGLSLCTWIQAGYEADARDCRVPLAHTWADAVRESAEGTAASGAVLADRRDVGAIDRAITEELEAIAAREAVVAKLRAARAQLAA